MINLEVRASVPYAEIAAQALVAMRSSAVTPSLIPGRVHVSDVLIHPSGTRLEVAVTFLADLKWPLPRVHGVLNLSVTPVYDGVTQTLRLKDVSFTADVDRLLARAAFAFKRGEIVDALSHVSLEVEPLLRGLRDRLNANLSGDGFAPGVTLQGHVETMRVDDILLAEDLVVVASASGQVRVIIDPRVVP